MARIFVDAGGPGTQPKRMVRFMSERALCDTERGDTEPGKAFVFALYPGQLWAGTTGTYSFCNPILVYALIRGSGMS